MASFSLIKSEVVVLNDENFDEAIQNNKFILVEFFAPWCGHCKHLAPEFEKAAESVKDEGIVLASVDGTQNQALMTRFQIRGFPTLFFFKNGASFPYAGPRDAEGIADWVRKKSGPVASTLSNSAEFTAFSTHPVSIVGHFEADSSAVQSFLDAASHPSLDSFKFGLVTDSEVSSLADASVGSIHLKRDFDEDLVFPVEATTTSADIATWINTNAYPYIDHASTSWPRLRDAGNPIGLLILDLDAADAADTKQLIGSIGKERKSEFSFAFIGSDFLSNAKEMGVSGDRLPTLVVLNSLSQSYPYPEDKEFNREAIGHWLTGIASGDVKPNFKSQPIPEDNNGPVTVVVGDNFEDVVLKSNSDVLIEFYAPWCGHCKTLAPIWEELGQFFSEDKEHIVIAKIDSTENDNPSIQVSGFPTIYFFPAINKSKPVEYTGARDLESLKSFINQQSSFKDAGGAHDHSHTGHDHSHGDVGHTHSHEEL